jgi:hypothetical protein
MATVEKIFEERGGEGLAQLIAKKLRGANPHQAIIEMVARLLDPQPDDDLALVVERRSRGNTKTKWVQRKNDIEIAAAVVNYELEHVKGGKPVLRKVAIGKIANQRRITDRRVRQALSNVLPMIPRS